MKLSKRLLFASVLAGFEKSYHRSISHKLLSLSSRAVAFVTVVAATSLK
jgi:hypothetical protein